MRNETLKEALNLVYVTFKSFVTSLLTFEQLQNKQNIYLIYYIFIKAKLKLKLHQCSETNQKTQQHLDKDHTHISEKCTI